MSCSTGGSVLCVPAEIGAGSLEELSGVVELRGLWLAVVLSCCRCAWLSVVCCGLAEEEWEKSGDAVGTWVPCWCPGDAWLDRLLVQGLFGGGGGGAPGRSIGASIKTGSS